MNMKERQSEGRVEDERIKKELRLKEIFLIVIYQKKIIPAELLFKLGYIFVMNKKNHRIS